MLPGLWLHRPLPQDGHFWAQRKWAAEGDGVRGTACQGHQVGAGRAALSLHKHNSCPLGPGRMPGVEDCLA